jgi:hypothetical protein
VSIISCQLFPGRAHPVPFAMDPTAENSSNTLAKGSHVAGDDIPRDGTGKRSITRSSNHQRSY